MTLQLTVQKFKIEHYCYLIIKNGNFYRIIYRICNFNYYSAFFRTKRSGGKYEHDLIYQTQP